MLYISGFVFDMINEACKNGDVEQGWLIGCKQDFEHIDACCWLPPSYADDNCYVMEPMLATHLVRSWAENNVCVIGFVHSHISDKDNLSRADIDSAVSLLKSLKMPFLYFGIIVTNTEIKDNSHYPLFMYLASSNDTSEYSVKQIPYTIIT